MRLGVNIDHIAVLREARKMNEPELLPSLFISKLAGADMITIHLREDRRHIDDDDAISVIKYSPLPVNLECSVAITDLVCDLKPYFATFVPEKREEVTTEGGLSLKTKKLESSIKKMQDTDIKVSLFVEPDEDLMQKCVALGAQKVEFHTGKYANLWAMAYTDLAKTKRSIKELEVPKAWLEELIEKELSKITKAAKAAKACGLEVAAGHGLNYQNVKNIAEIAEITELNIGQSIVARSIYVGFENAVKEMKALIC